MEKRGYNLNHSLLIIVLLLTLSTETNCQSSVNPIAGRQLNPGGVINEIPAKPPTLEGSFYLYNEWKMGTLVLKNDSEINNVGFRYDLLNELIDINYKNIQKMISPSDIKMLSFYDPIINFDKPIVYENVKMYNPNLDGIIRILHTGANFQLASKPTVIIKEPNYVPTVAVGNKNKQVIKEEHYYLIEGTEMIKIKRNRASIIKLSGEHSGHLKKYIKTEKLDMKKDADLVSAIVYYQSLIL